MSAKIIIGANKRITPGGFTESKRLRKKPIDTRGIVDAANRVINARIVREMSFLDRKKS